MLIYLAVCQATEKLYFGITRETLRRRSRKHITRAMRGSSLRLHQALVDFGPGSFIWIEVGYASTWEEACEAEKFLIQTFETTDPEIGYNMTGGGQGAVGLSLPLESRQKISAKLKQWHASDDPSAERLRAKNRANRLGSTTPSNVRQKISRSLTGRVLSKESRQKIGASNRRYGNAVVLEAVAHAKKFGFRSAERAFGIPRPTISRWSKALGSE